MPDSPDDESKLVVTRDGSHTVYSSQFDQHYHNPNGAVSESRHVFFEQTGLLEELNKRDEITILEVGFGTGLNLMLLMDYCLKQQSKAQIQYHSVEGFPLDIEIVKKFNYQEHLEHPAVIDDVSNIFNRLSRGLNTFTLSDKVTLYLFYGLFDGFAPGKEIMANYIFHDAFSPDANPDLWTGEVFKKLKNFSADDVILSTYSAASKAQGALAWAGWKVAKTKGALGKREMILAALNPDRLGDLKRVKEVHLAQRYEEGDFE
jgi:tRNA U34 5-methylaminomethyl-2-thiouridine-forming methyltransferase MnmC